MARHLQVTFDAHDPHRLAQWWAQLLDAEFEEHNDFVASLLESGVVTEAETVRVDGKLHFADAAAVSARDGTPPRLYFQRVPEDKQTKNRVHIDVPVEAEQLENRVEELVSRGATFVTYNSHPGQRWAVMQDPEGNEFCLH
jgi:predicted enzyme related to lactoylglutathione lyase